MDVTTNFLFEPLKDSAFDVYLKLGKIESERDSWDIPPGYFWVGEKLRKSKHAAARVLLAQFLRASLALPVRQLHPTSLQRLHPLPKPRRYHHARLASQ